jgi:hypothetical protein
MKAVENNHEIKTASDVLSLNSADVAQFVRACVRNRSLSLVVSDLNRVALHGAAVEQEEARLALKHLGFV